MQNGNVLCLLQDLRCGFTERIYEEVLYETDSILNVLLGLGNSDDSNYFLIDEISLATWEPMQINECVSKLC